MKDTNYPSEKQIELRILVEDFLEKTKAELERLDNSAAAELFWKLNKIFLRNTMPQGQPDAEDMEGTDLGKIVIRWHAVLNPIWTQLKKSLFHFWDQVLPERVSHESMVKAVDDPSSPMHQFSQLMGTAYNQVDQFYELKVKLSFDAGRVSMFRSDLNVVGGFIDAIRNAPIDLFARCRHCNKVIVVTRKGKSYCKGCAAKARQKEMWEKDPEGCREREKKRYEQKRKIKRG